MVFIDSGIEIIGITLLLSVASQMLRRKYAHPKEMKIQQDKMKEIGKKQKELMAKTDDKSKKESENLQNEMFQIMGEMNGKLMKNMMVSMVLFLPALFVLRTFYEGIIFGLPIPIPWFGENWSIQLYNETNWLGLYALLSLIFGLILNIIINIIEKNKEGK
ncbi:MAG: DUF106 domain-containing protein [Candidatus Diapherotrites archaeon]|nr:DUF106 domain-containing protein [Candidatus Diapherotrites archaeon]